MNLNMYLYKREKAQYIIVKLVSILCVLAIIVMPNSLVKAQAFGSNDSSQMQSAPTSPENDLAEEDSTEMDNSQQIYLPVIQVSIDIASLPAFQNIVAEQESLQDDIVMQDMFIEHLSSQHPMPRTIQEMETSYRTFTDDLGYSPDTGGKGHIEAIVTGQELLQNDVIQDTFTDHLSIQPTSQTVQEMKTGDLVLKIEVDHAPDTKRLVEANTDGHTE